MKTTIRKLYEWEILTELRDELQLSLYKNICNIIKDKYPDGSKILEIGPKIHGVKEFLEKNIYTVFEIPFRPEEEEEFDLSSFNLSEGSIDIIVLVNHLHYIHNIYKFFSHINKLLKINGEIILGVYNRKHFPHLYVAYSDILRSDFLVYLLRLYEIDIYSTLYFGQNPEDAFLVFLVGKKIREPQKFREWGIEAFNNKRYNEAAIMFEKVINYSEEPKPFDWYNLGMLQKLLGRDDLAYKNIKRAYEVASNEIPVIKEELAKFKVVNVFTCKDREITWEDIEALPSSKVKFLLVGFDGMTPNILFSYLDRFSQFKELCEQGCYGENESTSPPITGAAWGSIYTGVYPQNYAPDIDPFDITYLDIRAPKMWDIFNSFGISMGVINVPLAYQLGKMKGYIVPGRFTDLNKISPLVKDIFTGYIQEGFQNFNFTRAYFNDVVYGDRQTLYYTLLANSKYPQDILMVNFNAADSLGHAFWHRKEWLFEAYQILDKILFYLLSHIEYENLLIFSDHGMNAKNIPLTEEFGRLVSREGFISYMMGWHQKNGIFILCGKDVNIRKKFHIRVVDILPTICAFLNLDVDFDRFDGKPLSIR